jgi:hypothetical protein
MLDNAALRSLFTVKGGRLILWEATFVNKDLQPS